MLTLLVPERLCNRSSDKWAESLNRGGVMTLKSAGGVVPASYEGVAITRYIIEDLNIDRIAVESPDGRSRIFRLQQGEWKGVR